MEMELLTDRCLKAGKLEFFITARDALMNFVFVLLLEHCCQELQQQVEALQRQLVREE